MALIFLCSGWLVGVCLGLAYGAGADAHLLVRDAWPLLASLAGLSLLAFILARDDNRLRLTALVLGVAILGIWRAFAALPAANVVSLPEGVTSLRGTVSDRPEPRDAELLLVVDVDSVKQGEAWQPARTRVLVRTDRYEDWSYGDILTASGTPRQVSGSSYWADWLGRQGIFWTLEYARLEREAAPDPGPNPIGFVNRVRDRLQDLCGVLLPEPQASLLAGILVGGRTGMPQEFRDALNSTSTSHLVAVSGFNVTVVAGATLLLFLRFLTRRKATLVALAAVWGYAVLTGLPPSALRAAIMASMALASVLVGRDSDALSFLALSGAVMAGIDPPVIFDLGFQLSFLATAGLILLEPVLRGWITRIPGPLGKAPGWLLSSVTVTISAQLATLPLLATSFHTVSIISPVTNLLLAPALPGLMATGALAVSLGAIAEPLGRIVAPIAWAYLTYMVEVVERTSLVPSASIAVGNLDFPQVAGYYLVMLGIALWPLPELRSARGIARVLVAAIPRWMLVGGAAMVVSLAVLLGVGRPDGKLHVYFLDVGEGDAALVRAPDGRTVLIDGGPSPTSVESAMGRRLGFLDRDLDAVVLTGYDQDRLAGLLEVARRHHVRLVLQPGRAVGSRAAVAWAELVAERQLPVVRGEAGHRIELGSGIYLEVLWASERDATDPSMAVRLVAGGISMLFPGDLPPEAQRGLAGRAEVLRVPGQGAAGVLDDHFARAAAPRMAVISVGADNRFGHPAEVTLQQLKGASLFRTDRDGTVEVVIDGNGYEVYTEK